ncbi:hypothetical protein B0H14DRAFT_623466 [Mycena olivaceomarginata]|nr:hypothetical protein B0H14DRAFT_623466 [Mycena olivaceomarginata]
MEFGLMWDLCRIFGISCTCHGGAPDRTCNPFTISNFPAPAGLEPAASEFRRSKLRSSMSNASAAQAIFFQNYCHLFGVSFLIWDYIITIDVESQYLWKRAKSASAYWFFAIRYGGISNQYPGGRILVSHPTQEGECVRYDLAHQLFMLATQLLVSAVMILRIWALYGRRARVLWWLIGIASSFTAIAVVSATLSQIVPVPTRVSGACIRGNTASRSPSCRDCHLAVDESASYYLAGPWECLFAFDTMIFGMTTYKGYITRRDIGGVNMPIHRLLVRDGAMYFVTMALANLTNIVTFFIGGPLVPGSLATFATCMSVVMISRLMLNLHERTDVGVLTELRMSGIGGELAFTEMENLPLTQAEGSRQGSGVYYGLAGAITQMIFPAQ